MCLLCLFPIVKAISVRLQYFKDKTKQSRCLGNQKSPLVCSFSGEQGPSSSSSLDLPRPRPVCCPPRGPVSAPVSVMGSHLAPLLSAYLFVSVVLGRMVILWSPGVRAETGRTQCGSPRLPGPIGEPHLDTGGSQHSERSLPERWGQSRECHWAAETEAWEPQMSRGTQPC